MENDLKNLNFLDLGITCCFSITGVNYERCKADVYGTAGRITVIVLSIEIHALYKCPSSVVLEN